MADEPAAHGFGWQLHDALVSIGSGSALGLLTSAFAFDVSDSRLALTLGIALGVLAVWMALRWERARVGGRAGRVTIAVWVLGAASWTVIAVAVLAISSFT